MKRLPLSFLNRPAPTVARELIGMFLVRKIGKRKIATMITETEAYDGLRDKASHASRGQTKRNEIMFKPAGHIYVYFTYGMHWMLNIVTGAKGYPSAVLIRGVEGISGPARLTKALKIGKSLNGKIVGAGSGLWVADRGVRIQPRKIKRTGRIGVDYAGKEWAEKKWRFVLVSEI